jgi:DNA-3-methyladenine glycosylase II
MPPLDDRLTEASLAAAVAHLAAADLELAGIVDRFGLPPMWDRPPGFSTLVHLVLEQQVSLASARAAFVRLRAAADPLTPASFLALDDAALLAIGFSRQKARYVRELAAALESGTFDLDGLAELPDEDVSARLCSLTGIGPWTASCYLLLALLRRDAWPASDIALATAVAEVKGLGARPAAPELALIGDAYRPWRSVAARLFWHDYLSRRGQSDPFPG